MCFFSSPGEAEPNRHDDHMHVILAPHGLDMIAESVS